MKLDQLGFDVINRWWMSRGFFVGGCNQSRPWLCLIKWIKNESASHSRAKLPRIRGRPYFTVAEVVVWRVNLLLPHFCVCVLLRCRINILPISTCVLMCPDRWESRRSFDVNKSAYFCHQFLQSVQKVLETSRREKNPTHSSPERYLSNDLNFEWITKNDLWLIMSELTAN